MKSTNGFFLRALGLSELILGLLPVISLGHPGHGHGGSTSSTGHLSAALASIKPNDSLKISVDFFQYFSESMASNWGSGEPLGAGGKIPLVYNQSLYREIPFDRPELAKKDYWPQYRDFSYSPLWQPSQFGMRTQYQFLPGLWGVGTLSFFENLDKVSLSPGALQVNDLYFLWAPNVLPGAVLSIGRLLLVGSYAPIFDQFPLENFDFNGLSFAYNHSLGNWSSTQRLSAGRSPIGRTTRYVGIWSFSGDLSFLDGIRERTHLYATSMLQSKSGWTLGALGGYQVLPKESSSTANDSPDTVAWPTLDGWQIGGELGYYRGSFKNYLTASHGQNEVELAWGAPDMVYRSDLDLKRGGRFRREGSAITQLVYWGGFENSRFCFDWGMWGQWRSPNKKTDVFFYDRVLSDTSAVLDSVIAATQIFRAVKFSLESAIKLGNSALGMHIDGIRYLDKKATANTMEIRTDAALRPIVVRDPSSNVVIDSIRSASLWEREAADTWMFSPFIRYDVGNIFHIRSMWTGAWYSESIHRQRSNSDFHANITVSAWITYRFGIESDDF